MGYNWYALKLVAICTIVFVIQIIFPSLTDQFALDSASMMSRPWTLVTYVFLHASVSHLFYNMFALALFGLVLEKIVGGKKFLIIFFASGIAAGVGSALFYTSSIGASGAIYGIMGALAVLRPKMVVFTGFVPLPMFAAVALWAAGDFLGLVTPNDSIAYAAHLFGLAFGIAYSLSLRKKYSETALNEPKEELNDEDFKNWEDKYVK